MRIAEKRQAGEILGRGGISQRIIELSQDISEGTYKNAIEKAGQIHELVEAASFDEYWHEKASIGMRRECGVMNSLSSGKLDRGVVISRVDPFTPPQEQ